VPPAAALAVLGKGGGALIAVIVLMAITSSGSAEMVAVSSLLTYDIYKVFWNKKATGEHTQDDTMHFDPYISRV